MSIFGILTVVVQDTWPVPSLFLRIPIKEVGPSVTFGDNTKGFTKLHGTLKYNYVEFYNISCVKVLIYNLIAISKLCDDDYEVHFNKKEGIVIDINKKVVLNANRKKDI